MQAVTLIWAVLLPFLAPPQAANPQLRFEVADIKPSLNVEPGARVGIEDGPATVRIENLPLQALIRIAYGVMDAQVSGPGWLKDARFNITAKPPAGYQQGQLRVLVRNLLTDRFALAVHQEKKEVDGFALRVGTDGHRLVPATGERTYLTGRPGLIEGKRRTLAEIVPILAENVAAPVLDQTGLTGSYDVKLQWTPQLSAGAATGEPEISLFTALREQLGLRLERVRVPVDVVVIDRIAREPTEN